MSPPAPATGPGEAGPHGVGVIVCAPLRNDGEMMRAVLAEENIAAQTVSDLTARHLLANDKVLVCTQEALTRGVIAALEEVIAHQPAWASLPIVLLLDTEQNALAVTRELGTIVAQGLVTVLHRPIRQLEFRTAVANALTARRRQLEISSHLDLQLELRRELNHRVKNTVATFHAIYLMTLKQSQSLGEFDEKFSGRLRALSKVHEILYDTTGVQPVLRDLAEVIVAPYDQPTERVQVEGDNLALDRDQALTTALVLNELVTNAAKYGALRPDGGTVALHWGVDADGAQMHLKWTERAIEAITEPSRRGYGTHFVTQSIRSLGGTTRFDYMPSGLEFSMTLPLHTAMS